MEGGVVSDGVSRRTSGVYAREYVSAVKSFMEVTPSEQEHDVHG